MPLALDLAVQRQDQRRAVRGAHAGDQPLDEGTVLHDIELDEPSLGLAPLIVQQVFRIVSRIRDRGTTVLLVEQNANVALSVADRGYVLEAGALMVSGRPDELWSNPQVRAAYLGGLATA